MRSFLPLLLSVACVAPGDGPAVVFDPGGAFYDAPFPSDARRTEAGAMDWSGFPNPGELPLLDDYKAIALDTPGAAHNAPVYLRLSALPDPRLLPTPETSVEPWSTVQLVNVDVRSPSLGQRVPVRIETWDTEGTFVVPGLMAVAPYPGFPLDRRTTYAVLITTDLATPTPRFDNALDGEGAWGASLGPLIDALPVLGMRPSQIALATVFTTGDPIAELDVAAAYLTEKIAPPRIGQVLERRYTLADYEVFRTNYTTPVFQQGTKPYANTGGNVQFQASNGAPIVAGFDPMRMSVAAPVDRSDPPEDGWPILVYLHGTGGDYRTFCNSSSDLEVASWLTRLGAVGIGIDLPLHGPRGTDDTVIDLHSFNVLQPDSALWIHRQGALDLVYLLRGLTFREPVFFTPEGDPLRLDRRRIIVMGHSQGGLSAALALPFASRYIDGAVLSGAGGLLAITAVERDSDYDFPTLIQGLLSFADDEPLTELHPILALVQSLVERTDPINYAPYWFHRNHDRDENPFRPRPVLLTSGMRDDQTPSRTAEALASAARMPFVGPRWSVGTSLLLRGLDSQPLPVSGNVLGHNGDPITAGLSQWDDGSHFVLFQEPAARDIAASFVQSVLFDDVPVIASGPVVDEAAP